MPQLMYRDSGIKSIGVIPDEWECVRISRVLEKSKNGIMVGPFGSSLTNAVVGKNEGSYKIYGQANLIRRDFEFGDKYVTKEKYEELQNYEVIPGDIAVSMMGTIGKCRVVPAGIETGIMDSHLIKLRLNDSINPYYFEYIYESIAVFDQIMAQSKGSIMTGLNSTIVKNLFIVLPPIDEQHMIVSYLDKKVAHIDTLISEAKVSIEEYKQWKASIIYEAVTKGLDPDVDLKDSGVEWIGEIPNHWDVIRVKNIGTTQNGVSKGSEYFGEGYPFVNYGDVYKNYELPLTGSGLASSSESDRQLYSVKYGDIFFTRTSETAAEVGFSAVCMNTITNATFSGFVIRLRPYNVDSVIYTRFAKYYFRSPHIRNYLVGEMNIVTRVSMSQSLLGAMSVAIPPLDEQKVIAAYLENKCTIIDSLIDEKLSLIDELESYKKSLIFEVVTGKRKVC